MSTQGKLRNHNGYGIGERRGNIRRTLALRWIKLHRPDVYEAIDNEAYKAFPDEKGRQRHVGELPAALVKLK